MRLDDILSYDEKEVVVVVFDQYTQIWKDPHKNAYIFFYPLLK